MFHTCFSHVLRQSRLISTSKNSNSFLRNNPTKYNINHWPCPQSYHTLSKRILESDAKQCSVCMLAEWLLHLLAIFSSEDIVSQPCASKVLKFFSSLLQEVELIIKDSNSVISSMSQQQPEFPSQKLFYPFGHHISLSKSHNQDRMGVNSLNSIKSPRKT